ncbi:hypothetical protein ACFS07_29625 [Undibacterium arcticum]
MRIERQGQHAAFAVHGGAIANVKERNRQQRTILHNTDTPRAFYDKQPGIRARRRQKKSGLDNPVATVCSANAGIVLLPTAGGLPV